VLALTQESQCVVWHKKHPDESHRGVDICIGIDAW